MSSGLTSSGSASASPWLALATALHPEEVAHLEALGHAMGFHPDDLEAHRTGNWSRRDRLKRGGIGCGAAAFLGVPVIVASALMTSSVEQFVEMAGTILPFPMIVFMAIILPALFGSVRAVDGIVTLSSRYESEESSTGGSVIFLQPYVHVNGESFKVDRRVAAAVWIGCPYRLYITSWGKRLVSMEPFPGARTAVIGYPHQGPWRPS